MYDHFRCAALPSDLQLQQLWLRPLDDSDVLDQQAEHTLAITCFGGRSGPQSWEVAGQLQDLSLLFGADGAQRLTLEVGELRLEVEHALCRIIPALLEGAGDQPVVGIDHLVAPFRQISLIASALDPPPPLRANGVIALFETGQGLQ